MVDQIKDPLQILFIQGTEGIDNGKCIWFQFVYILDQLQQFGIRVAQNVNWLDIETISPVADAAAEIDDVMAFIFKKTGPDAVDGASVTGLQIVDGVPAVICQAHIGCLSAVLRKEWPKLGCIVENGAPCLMRFIFQKTTFNHINSTFGKPLDNTLDGSIAKLAVDEIATVPQGAVQNIYSFHLFSLPIIFSTCATCSGRSTPMEVYSVSFSRIL